MPSFKIIHRTSGSEGDFLKVVTVYGHGGHLRHVIQPIYIVFGPTFPQMLHIKNGFEWSSGFKEDL